MKQLDLNFRSGSWRKPLIVDLRFLFLKFVSMAVTFSCSAK